ncbi:uncharacterized protein P174DRAFT_500639 [Aspergillus novofumigatus IBT 16806]|uniref:Uncharacterized protein n=1 Tax=Aspergillus novofumigatus (strain IBT 16806) TaxID=1392255 RepID=A0A2I1CN85_ASPN1|nr:uncharacterized protein P174DRAFT_500639 [Aspergillus novofumigatus IBT 16806]PKX99076.1 hypothetical protein P174DRAFT_500639 [Aspergillus novofumigatus IBT 16806]
MATNQSTQSPQPTEPITQPTPASNAQAAYVHILFDVKASPKKLKPIVLESLHHKIYHRDVKIYHSFEVMKNAGAVRRGNVIVSLNAEGMNEDQIVMAARTKIQHLSMDWDKNELAGEELFLVIENKAWSSGWGLMPYSAWKEQAKRR